MLQHLFKKGETIMIEIYLQILRTNKSMMETVASRRPYICKQDGAPAHTSYLMQNWLSDNADMFWPPNSPNLNPLDYYLWDCIQQVSDKFRHPNMATFTNLDKEQLKRAYSSSRKRIKVVIRGLL